jgi:tetratricopeptide (TPR) repeat protein
VRRRPIACGVLVVLLGTASWLWLWPDHLFRSGEQALGRGDYTRAGRQFERYLRYRPRSAAGHRLAARAALRRGALEETERHLQAAEKLEGITPESALERVLLAARRGALEGVEQQLWSLAKQDHPEAMSVLEALSRGYLASGRPARALEAAEALLRRAPDSPEGHLGWARAAEALDHRDEALPHYLRAVDLDPAGDEARLHLADCLASLGRPREAQAQFACILRRRPGDPAALYGLARCKFDAHEWEEARDRLDTLLGRAPDHVPALLERGRLAARLQGPAAAEDWLYRAVDHAPEDPSTYRLLIACLKAQQKDANGIEARLRQVQEDRARRFKDFMDQEASSREPGEPRPGR